MISNLREDSHQQNTNETRFLELIDRLRSAETQFGREPESVSLVAVSKTQDSANIRDVAALHQKDFGENQIQEALRKITDLSDINCVWHFIGSIQTNKCRDIAAHFDWVHSVDRLKIAQRLSNLRSSRSQPLNIFLQVNVQNESTKSGIAPNQLIDLANAVSKLPNLYLRGLMIVPKLESDFNQQRKIFREVKQLQIGLNQQLNLKLDCLSMGMTKDLEAAVAEGATHIRIGTAIFGPRDFSR